MSHAADTRRLPDKVKWTLMNGVSLAESGFTLIELMITLSVMAILLAIAVPSFQDVALSSKLTVLANDFVASAQLARSEAIKRNRPATLCASSDGASCTGAWSDGWVVLRDDGAVITTGKKLPTGFVMSGNVTSISFSATGVGANPVTATLTICRKTPSVGSRERVVSISTTGRPSVAKTTTGLCS